MKEYYFELTTLTLSDSRVCSVVVDQSRIMENLVSDPTTLTPKNK